jgi:hypothetical protein
MRETRGEGRGERKGARGQLPILHIHHVPILPPPPRPNVLYKYFHTSGGDIPFLGSIKTHAKVVYTLVALVVL